MRKRTGTIYYEMTNKGRSSIKHTRGAKPIYCFRWVAEIMVHGKRFRKRSADYDNVRFWLDNMATRYKDEQIRGGIA